ncbi:MAG TPA: trimeric intracellular cation channel family protein [Vicinamibacteria bacterium]|nr:trimeric intracellular cation channel family protein [Vicinamibacteria bacterium]
MSFATLLRAFEVAAVVFAALSGIVDARRKNLDLVGAFVVGLVTAFGGGTLRDVLLDRRPLFWVARPEYTVIVLGLSVAYLYLPLATRMLRERPVLILADVLDAAALGLFGGLGIQAAQDLGVPAFVAVLFGVMTGAFGGVLRDIVLNEVPLLFRPTSELYATAVFAGGLVHVALVRAGAAPSSALAGGALVTITIRLLAIRFGWRLPAVRSRDQ